MCSTRKYSMFLYQNGFLHNKNTSCMDQQIQLYLFSLPLIALSSIFEQVMSSGIQWKWKTIQRIERWMHTLFLETKQWIYLHINTIRFVPLFEFVENKTILVLE